MFRIGKDNQHPAAATTPPNSAGRATINTAQTSTNSTMRGDAGLNRGGSSHRASELRARATDASSSTIANAANKKSDQDAIADALETLSIFPGSSKIAAANEACKAGDAKKIEAVRTLIRHRLLDVNARLENGNTFLHDIVMETIDPSYDQTDRAGHLSIAKRISTLAELGADVSINGDNGFTPLHLAALADYPLIVATLLEHEENVGFRKENGERLKMTHFRADDGKTPLHLAAEMGNDQQVVELLIEAGANVDDGDNFDNRPLHLAVGGECDLDVIAALIEGGANVNATNQYSMSPLHVAAAREACDPQVLVALLLGGANVDERAAASGRTALHFAAEHADLETVAALLELGADVNVIDGFGRSPLHEAAGRGDAEVVMALLDAGAEPNIKDRERVTPLQMAVSQGFQDDVVANVLKHFGARLR